MSIIVEPLQKFHIELELAISHLFSLNSLIHFEFCQNIIKNFQIPSEIVLVLCIEIKPMQRDTSIRMNSIQYLAISDGITAELHFWVVSLGYLIDPCQQLQAAQVSGFHYSNYNIIKWCISSYLQPSQTQCQPQASQVQSAARSTATDSTYPSRTQSKWQPSFATSTFRLTTYQPRGKRIGSNVPRPRMIPNGSVHQSSANT